MAHHVFTPEVYYRAIGSHEPVLRIQDGDTVSTSTVDSTGGDASGEQVTLRGNPQTGPFYIENAEPGDILAVTFDKITPNRSKGYTSSVIAPNVVEPAYVRSLPKAGRAFWEVDVANETVKLVQAEFDFKPLELPMEPMLGCFGVAPDRGQAISTATSGPHGGNMDYRGFGPGVTAYLPVFVEGALFHLGDGHALQGDGEIVGTGVEISMDVTFTVRVIKGKTAHWPRGENDKEIFTVGNARPIDQALQHATTEMLRWLEDDYGFKPLDAHALLGQVVRYDVGNIFNPAYTAVCRVSKEFLE